MNVDDFQVKFCFVCFLIYCFKIEVEFSSWSSKKVNSWSNTWTMIAIGWFYLSISGFECTALDARSENTDISSWWNHQNKFCHSNNQLLSLTGSLWCSCTHYFTHTLAQLFIHTLNYKVLKINLQRLWLVTNQYSDLNINLKDFILNYKDLELNQKYFKNESFGFKFKSQWLVTNHNP